MCIVSGNLKTLSSGLIAQGSVIFELGNIGTGNPITVPGVTVIPALKYSAQSTADGSFSTFVYGNDVLSPINTIYNVTFRDTSGNEIGPIQYSITGPTANLNTLAAVSATTPPVLAPASLPVVEVSISLAPQSASIGSTLLFAVINSGIYRVTADLVTTTAGTAGTVTATIAWNNGSSGVSITTPSASLSVLGSENLSSGVGGNSFTFYSAASQNINYTTTNSGSTGQYQLRLRLEYLG